MSEARASQGHIFYGVKAIAAFLGIKDRQALHLVESGRLPVFRVGRIVCIKRATLVAWLDEQERQEGRANAG